LQIANAQRTLSSLKNHWKKGDEEAFNDQLAALKLQMKNLCMAGKQYETIEEGESGDN
jgi:hypothetical protein